MRTTAHAWERTPRSAANSADAPSSRSASGASSASSTVNGSRFPVTAWNGVSANTRAPRTAAISFREKPLVMVVSKRATSVSCTYSTAEAGPLGFVPTASGTGLPDRLQLWKVDFAAMVTGAMFAVTLTTVTSAPWMFCWMMGYSKDIPDVSTLPSIGRKT